MDMKQEVVRKGNVCEIGRCEKGSNVYEIWSCENEIIYVK